MPKKPEQTHAFRILQITAIQYSLVSLVITLALLVLLCTVFNPRWETNDDVWMSMMAHGYGEYLFGSPQIISSNVLWGYVIRLLPQINGVLGYSLATLGILILTAWSYLYLSLSLSSDYFLSLTTFFLIIPKAILFPQFTVNSGLLTLVALLGWRVAARDQNLFILIGASCLAFLGFLIRWQEFCLILFIGLPFFPWTTFKKRRSFQIVIAALVCLIILAAIFDHCSYLGSEWEKFSDLISPINKIINFGFGTHLVEHPEILARHGFSINDISLVSSWFYVDPRLANPKTLSTMLQELGSYFQGDFWQRTIFAPLMFINPQILPLFLAAICVLLFDRRKSLALALLLTLGSIFLLGSRGGFNLYRVFFPIISLLLASAVFFIESAKSAYLKYTLFLFMVWNSYILAHEATTSDSDIQLVMQDLEAFGHPQSVVRWDAAYHYEYVFPLLAHNLLLRQIKNYGTHTGPIPSSIAFAEERAGEGLLKQLQTMKGISIVTYPSYLSLLAGYCFEHFKKQLDIIEIKKGKTMTLFTVRCMKQIE